jgi:hypothetical protein
MRKSTNPITAVAAIIGRYARRPGKKAKIAATIYRSFFFIEPDP